MFVNRGSAAPIYDQVDEVDAALHKSQKYPPLQKPDNAFNRLSKKQKKGGANDALDVEAVEKEMLKCLNESTTRRLYQPSEQVPLAKQKQFRSMFVSELLDLTLFLTRYMHKQTQELYKCYPSLFPQALMAAKVKLGQQTPA